MREPWADLLADPDRLAGWVAGGDVLDEARALLDEAAIAAAALGGWTPDDPLRLSKAPVTWLLRCPRRAVADPEGDGALGGDPDDLAVGLLVDAGAKLASLRPAQPVTVESALAFLTATGDTTVRERLALLAPPPPADGPPPDLPDLPDPPSDSPSGAAPAGGGDAAAALLEVAGARLDVLLAGWPRIEGAWWPRVEEPVRARLAGGAVVVSGRIDLLLGGPPTDRPGLAVEVKAGRWHDQVRSDGHLYGLLLGLRDGVAPAAVLSVAAGDGATQLEPLRAEVLNHAAERVAEALRVAGHLAAGEAPEARPGSHCAYCPLRSTCPESHSPAETEAA